MAKRTTTTTNKPAPAAEETAPPAPAETAPAPVTDTRPDPVVEVREDDGAAATAETAAEERFAANLATQPADGTPPVQPPESDPVEADLRRIADRIRPLLHQVRKNGPHTGLTTPSPTPHLTGAEAEVQATIFNALRASGTDLRAQDNVVRWFLQLFLP